ncbi:5'/3'-nucleotidase SurE [Dysgonomonas sp. 25]|uniref:5'/3'-nucleotidase SurE n=1 Tax=Dysgonomonas sp. 25 TaxID=2302933 RepID=UPI0013D2B70E|nr:5'/3'-nucleotidase SurE [Dysgonomonas sp. 25]NDV68021.1 5'/3'-nucleotidase SurE [Dysgonomonas sp. 25]
MKKQKPLIFITNDDGYQAGGINALIDSMRGLGEIVVVAPDGPRSGMSSAITSINPLRAHLLEEQDDLKIYACTGTPVDCVKLGISEICDRKPDLVVTGINHGSNAAIAVLYSGTMGAALEGCVFEVPSIGFSLLDHSKDADFGEAQKYTRLISEQVLKSGLPKGTCLNVNIPKGDDIKGIRICRQTSGKWVEEFDRSQDGIGKEVYWLTGHFRNDEPEDESTDEWALHNGYVSIVPTKVDMTHHDFMDVIRHLEQL